MTRIVPLSNCICIPCLGCVWLLPRTMVCQVGRQWSGVERVDQRAPRAQPMPRTAALRDLTGDRKLPAVELDAAAADAVAVLRDVMLDAAHDVGERVAAARAVLEAADRARFAAPSGP